jgi:chromosome segregation ATPase
MFMQSTEKKRPSEVRDDAAAAPPQTDQRDAEVERLEQALAEERQHTATLRATVEDLRFKATILEKSYAKQLADARARAEAAERGLAEEKARLAGIDGNHENTLRILAETRGQLANVAAERDMLLSNFAPGTPAAATAAPPPPAEPTLRVRTATIPRPPRPRTSSR